MKKLSLRVAMATIAIVTISTVTSFVLSLIVMRFLIPQVGAMQTMFFGMAVREMITPVMTVVIAVVIVATTMRRLTNPVSVVSDATEKIANGDFSVRIDESGKDDEISRLQCNFNRMARELESNELLKKDFAANMSHQLKTPLSIIKGYSKLLSGDNISDADRVKYAGLIERESENLARLSENILRLTRLESQELIESPNEFLLDEQILQEIVRLQPKWESKDIEIDVDVEETTYRGDEELLSHVWSNLLENAVRYTECGGKISVSLHKKDGEIEVAVSDNGTGMDEETKSRAFSRFYRGESVKSKSGSGLGLSIAERIIELHDGRILLESELGEGTTVTTILPLG